MRCLAPLARANKSVNTMKPSAPAMARMLMTALSAKLFWKGTKPLENRLKPAVQKAEILWKIPSQTTLDSPAAWKMKASAIAPTSSNPMVKKTMLRMKCSTLNPFGRLKSYCSNSELRELSFLRRMRTKKEPKDM